MRQNKITILYKYQPLFDLLKKDFHPDVDTVIITGGRYSLKSYTVSIFALLALYNYNWNVLYTRYTNMSIVDSIKPEVSDKIELLGLQGELKDTQNSIEYGDYRIAFKGIKTGSYSQTANLKSLSGFNLFVNDEAEELPDYKTFKKTFYSIRSTEKRNLTILILNPTTKEHWIYKEFFEKKGIEGGSNCIKDNVMYIHSSYLDCDFELMPKNILSDYERLKTENPDEYENIVLGGWITEPEGVLLPKSKLTFKDISNIPKEIIHFRFAIGDPADKGGDKFSTIFCDVATIENNIVIYVRDVIHNNNGIEANVELLRDKIKDNMTEYIALESNGVGVASIYSLKKILPQNVILNSFYSNANKETRILSHYHFVKKFFVFNENYKSNIEYLQFINDLTNYMKEGDNKHRMDAIDVCCSVANFIKLKYYKVIYS